MNKRLARTIINSLGFSNDSASTMRGLSEFDSDAWQRTFQWLYNANLALYLLRRLEQENATGFLPPSVLSRLRRNLLSNRVRVACMGDAFRSINVAFGEAGLVCPVIKGFSLVPSSCPDFCLRQTSDIDFLVEEKDQVIAEKQLFNLGYSLKSHIPREWKYHKGPLRIPMSPEGQYDSQTAFVVELHLDVWDQAEQGIEIPTLITRGYKTQRQEWGGSVFNALSDGDSFLLQVVHTMRHIFDGWTKLSWFYEIGYFLNRTCEDGAVWEEIKRACAGNKVLRDFVSVISQLASRFFSAPMPLVVREFSQQLRSSAQLWIERYGNQLLLAKVPVYEMAFLPTAPCALFLQREFLANKQCAQSVVRNRLFPRATRTRAALRDLHQRPTMVLNGKWLQQQKLFRKSVYFAGSNLRYWLELPRWHWRNAMAKLKVRVR